MAATTAGYDWPRPRSNTFSHPSDTASPMYPDRPIRPLPKRRIRSRLSPEQAGALLYPPAPPTSTPLFSFPYGQIGKENQHGPGTTSGRVHPDDPEYTCECGEHSEHESDLDDDEYDRLDVARSSPSHGHGPGARQGPGNGGGLMLMRGNAAASAATAGSAASSPDGYESFENTNNKKKRKIPVSGGANGHHASNLSADLTNMSLSNGGEVVAAVDPSSGSAGQYYSGGTALTPSTPGSGTGISGAGRGRYGRAGRSLSERRPLGASTNALNAYLGPTARRSQVNGAGPQKGSPQDQGIISAAIANAAEHPPVTPQKGNENVSLLQQEASKTPPQKTQFTFTCGSDSANKMIWPGQSQTSAPTPSPTNAPSHQTSRIPLPVSGSRRSVATQGTQTTSHLPMPSPGSAQSSQGQSQQQAHGGVAATQQQQPTPAKPRPRRTREAQYAFNARQRRDQQYEYNLRHPPTRDDIWICEFCEYESIFGEIPKALIYQYEAKDRKERKRAAEKRRLLEKAKMKGRKGRKGKGGKKDSHGANNSNGGTAATSTPVNQQGQYVDDGFYEDEDEYVQEGGYVPAPPPAPTAAAVPATQAAKEGLKSDPGIGAGGGGVPGQNAVKHGGGGGKNA